MLRSACSLLTLLLLGAAALATCVSASEDNMDGVAFQWDYEDTDEAGEAYGEGRSLLAYGQPRRFGFFIRAITLNRQQNTCASFWQLSRPRGSDYPSRAYRQATRELIDQVTFTDMGLDNGRLRTLRMLCRATKVTRNNQRKIIRMDTIAAIPEDRQAEYASLMSGYIRAGTWTTAVCSNMQNAFVNLDKWCPRSAKPTDLAL